MRKTTIGVMGPGAPASDEIIRLARGMGEIIARRNWVLVTGGRQAGVMDAASQGAKEAGGLVVGILPDSDDGNLSPFVDIAIKTDMGSARNNINILSSDVVVACGLGAGTASEICLALKAGRPVILLGLQPADREFFRRLDSKLVSSADSPDEAERIIVNLLERRANRGD